MKTGLNQQHRLNLETFLLQRYTAFCGDVSDIYCTGFQHCYPGRFLGYEHDNKILEGRSLPPVVSNGGVFEPITRNVLGELPWPGTHRVLHEVVNAILFDIVLGHDHALIYGKTAQYI